MYIHKESWLFILLWCANTYASQPVTPQAAAASATPAQPTDQTYSFAIHHLMHLSRTQIHADQQLLIAVTKAHPFLQAISKIEADLHQKEADIDQCKQKLATCPPEQRAHKQQELDRLIKEERDLASKEDQELKTLSLDGQQLGYLMVYYRQRYRMCYPIAAHSLAQAGAAAERTDTALKQAYSNLAQAASVAAQNKELALELERVRKENSELRKALATQQPMKIDSPPHLTSPTDSVLGKRKRTPLRIVTDREAALLKMAEMERLSIPPAKRTAISDSGDLGPDQKQQDAGSD